MSGRFGKVIVIGYGKIAGDVLRHVAQRQRAFGYLTSYIEYEPHGMSSLCGACKKYGAEYIRVTEREELDRMFLSVTEPALVVSAGNNYLFPREVIEKSNLEIINFHSALLPKYPGRNAQSWAIYEGEKTSGATWHYVTGEVDGGAIISQRETPLTEDIRAYELTKDIMVKAFEGFRDFFEELLVRHIEGRPQPAQAGKRKIYYSWELPGGGGCSLDDSPEYIYRLLRAMDYGRSGIFPPAWIRMPDGTRKEVLRYRKTAESPLSGKREMASGKDGREIRLSMDGKHELEIIFI